MKPNFSFLHELRSGLGPSYGSEDLCVLLYSLVKRERPSLVVELGTGHGVTTAWVAAAMVENGHGAIVSFDNGKHFANSGERILGTLDGSLEELRICAQDYPAFLGQVFDRAGVSERVHMRYTDMSLNELDWLDRALLETNTGPAIDMLFSDFNHSPDAVGKIVGRFLPKMSPIASIFIDSASTSLTSLLTLERITALLKEGKLPRELAALFSENHDIEKVRARVRDSQFELIHLIERQNRAQNSTAWLRIEPAGIIPAQVTCLH